LEKVAVIEVAEEGFWTFFDIVLVLDLQSTSLKSLTCDLGGKLLQV